MYDAGGREGCLWEAYYSGPDILYRVSSDRGRDRRAALVDGSHEQSGIRKLIGGECRLLVASQVDWAHRKLEHKDFA